MLKYSQLVNLVIFMSYLFAIKQLLKVFSFQRVVNISFPIIIVLLMTLNTASYSQNLTNPVSNRIKPAPQTNVIKLYKEPVILDGRILFYVAEKDMISAKNRALEIPSDIQDILKNSNKKARVQLIKENNDYKLMLEDEEITTVTAKDAKVNKTRIRPLARQWKNAINSYIINNMDEDDFISENDIFSDIGIATLILLAIMALSVFFQKYASIFINYTAQLLITKFQEVLNEIKIQKENSSEAIDDENIEKQKSAITKKIDILSKELNKLLSYSSIFVRVLSVVVYINFILYIFPFTYPYIKKITNFEISIGDIIKDSILKWVTSSITWEAFGRIVFVLIVAFIVFWLFSILSTTIENILEVMFETSQKRKKRFYTIFAIASTTVKVILVVLVIIIILSEVGVNIAPILAGAGIIGLAVSFGAQSLVKDIINGTFILSENQFDINDVVTIQDTSGVVEKMTLRITMLRDMAGTAHIIPNGSITKVSVLTKGWSRADISIRISYNSDLNQSIKVMKEIADQLRKEFPDIIIAEPQILGVDNFADLGVILRLTMTTTPGQQWFVEREYRRRIKYALNDNGIKMM